MLQAVTSRQANSLWRLSLPVTSSSDSQSHSAVAEAHISSFRYHITGHSASTLWMRSFFGTCAAMWTRMPHRRSIRSHIAMRVLPDVSHMTSILATSLSSTSDTTVRRTSQRSIATVSSLREPSDGWCLTSHGWRAPSISSTSSVYAVRWVSQVMTRSLADAVSVI